MKNQKGFLPLYKKINQLQKDIKSNKIHKKLHKVAVAHFKENFSKKSFKSKKWGKGKNGKEGGDLVGSGSLKSSITKDSRVVGDKIVFRFPQPYAQTHNEGGTVRVKAHRRTSSKGKNYQVKSFSYHMPKRQFIGDSPALREKFNKTIISYFTDILK